MKAKFKVILMNRVKELKEIIETKKEFLNPLDEPSKQTEKRVEIARLEELLKFNEKLLCLL